MIHSLLKGWDMMKKQVFVIAIVLLFFIISLCGCNEESADNQNNLDKFIGKWEYDYQIGSDDFIKQYMTFYENGTMNYMGIYLTYKVSNNKLHLSSEQMGGDIDYNCEFTNNYNTLSLDPIVEYTGDKIILTKIEDKGPYIKQLSECNIELPYLIIDSEDNSIILYGRDLREYTGEVGSDGEHDIILFNKYDSNGIKTVENKTIISSKAIIYPVFSITEEDEIYLFWLDPRNNPDFVSNSGPYIIDIYYKIIDNEGNIIQNDTRLTEDLINEAIEYETFNLSNYEEIPIGCTLKELHKIDCYYGEIELATLSYSMVVVDSENNEHYFKVASNDLSDLPAKIEYTKIDSEGNILVDNYEIISFNKEAGLMYGPDIQHLDIAIDSKDYIHLLWQLNNGGNHFTYHYIKLNKNGEEIINENLGEKR